MSASENAFFAENVAARSEEPPAFVSRNYYPGTNDFRDATPVVVKEGQHAGGINVDIKTVSGGVTVSGTVFNPLPGGEPLPDGTLRRAIGMLLIPTREGISESVWSIRLEEAPMFFEIRNVLPGEYDLYGTFMDRTVPAGEAYALPRYFSSRTRIEVGDKDLISLTIEKAEIRGQF